MLAISVAAPLPGIFAVQPVFAVQSLDPAFLPDGLPTLTGERNEPDLDADKARVILSQRVVNVVMGTAGVAATFVIVLSGFMIVISDGNDEKLGKAKKSIAWALGGLVAIIISYSVISYVIKLGLMADDSSANRSALPQESQNQQSQIGVQQSQINERNQRDIYESGVGRD